MPKPAADFKIGDRRCTTCGHIGPLEDFAQHARAHFGRSSWCNRCKNDGSHERVSRHRAKRRVLIDAFKNRPCADCGGTFPPWIMDLDHVRGEKAFIISAAVAINCPLPRLEEELAKCDVVCSNCHRQRSYECGHIYRHFQQQPGKRKYDW